MDRSEPREIRANVPKGTPISESEQFMLASYEGYSHALSSDAQLTQGAIRQLVELYDASGRLDKAAEWRAKLAKDAVSKQ